MIMPMSSAPSDQFLDGFLSEAVRNLRTEAHAASPDLVTMLYSFNRLAVQLMHEVQVHPEKSEEVVGAVLYARTVQSTQAAVLLLEHGLPSQAQTVLRSALETLFPLAAMAKDPRVATELIASHNADRRTLADRIKQWKHPDLRAAVPLTDAELDAIVKSPARATNIFATAKLAGMEDWYHTLYTIMSFAAHSKMSDLDKHAVADADGALQGLQSEPIVEGQGKVWLWVVEVQLAAMRSTAQLFDLKEWEVLANSRWQLLHAMAKKGDLFSPPPRAT